MENKSLKKEISLFMATMLVCGNMIGSGVFMLPSTLAQVAGPGSTIIAWILTTIGSILIAISFANLGTKYPSTGGAYQYTKEAFGDFAGFLISKLKLFAIISSIDTFQATSFSSRFVHHSRSFLKSL